MSGEEEISHVSIPDNRSEHIVLFEHSWSHETSHPRCALRLDETPKARVLRTIYGSIKVLEVSAEMRQDCLLGAEDGTVRPTGHMFISLIPTIRNTEAATGHSSGVVNSVPNKSSFPMSAVELKTYNYVFDLRGYETNLAEDPRRGAGIVLWTGNSGIVSNFKKDVPIASVTWKVKVACSGPSVVW